MEKEVSAKTIDEAIELALREMQLKREEVEVEVLDEGSAGLFGLGAREARVRVKSKQAVATEAEVSAIAKEILEKLLAAMGVRATVRAVTPKDEGLSGMAPVALDVSGEDLGILIGRRGETLSSLQHIVNLMVSRRIKSYAGVAVDVEGYKERRREALRSLALRVAERVKSTGRVVTLEPMPAAERRIVHLALRDDPEVTTQSFGDGESRKVAISPKTK
jgi:spoIIIJ-associated protein